MRHQHCALAVALVVSIFNCSDTKQVPNDSSIDVPLQDTSTDTSTDTTDGPGCTCDQKGLDEDKDGITNREESCCDNKDTDADKTPDWKDTDSDGDGIPDTIEGGEKDSNGKCKGATGKETSWPCDSDGDGLPDYLDEDSDGDLRFDKNEDPNGDGLVGCCLAACGKPGSIQKTSCTFLTNGCGAGQTCTSGSCSPLAHIECARGETDTKKKDTFGDGVQDNLRGTDICQDAASGAKGRRPLVIHKNTTAGWQLALGADVTYKDIIITGAGPKEAMATLDIDKTDGSVAGFIISKDITTDKLPDQRSELIKTLAAHAKANSGVHELAISGQVGRTHDGFELIHSYTSFLKVKSSQQITDVRDTVAKLLLPGLTFTNLPKAFGPSATDFIVRLALVRRFEFKKDSGGKVVKDATGNPVDSGNTAAWRLFVVGAVAARYDYFNAKKTSRTAVNELADGTALANTTDALIRGCATGTIKKKPVADIIWVMDESSSMSSRRNDIVNNVNNFYSWMQYLDVDYRMGVTNGCDPSGAYSSSVGKFCSKASTSNTDDGGTDRFLTPKEQTLFCSCLKNPPGYENGNVYGLVNAKKAVEKHLPRKAGDTAKIRPDATLALIIVTDLVPKTISTALTNHHASCVLDSATTANVTPLVQPFVKFFDGSDGAKGAALVYAIAGECSNSCNADVPHGYRSVINGSGGQLGEVCQKDPGNTLMLILDDITAHASDTSLDVTPVSASLALAVDSTAINLGLPAGYAYSRSASAFILPSSAYAAGSKYVVAYSRWAATP